MLVASTRIPFGRVGPVTSLTLERFPMPWLTFSMLSAETLERLPFARIIPGNWIMTWVGPIWPAPKLCSRAVIPCTLSAFNSFFPVACHEKDGIVRAHSEHYCEQKRGGCVSDWNDVFADEEQPPLSNHQRHSDSA